MGQFAEVKHSGGQGPEAEGEALRLLQKTIDALADHVAVLNKEGTIVAVNEKWRVFADSEGLRLSNHGLGANYLRVCETARGPNSEEARLVAVGIRGLLADTETDLRCEYPCHSPTVERWFQLRGSCFSDQGQIYVVLAHQCVTPLKIVERALRESEQRYRALVELAPDGVVVHQDNILVYANPEALRLAGATSPEEVLGQDLSKFLPPQEHHKVRERVRKVLAGTPTGPNETELLRRDGGLVPTETQASLVQWSGRPAVQVIIRDIRDRKRIQNALLRQRDELDQVVRERTAQLQETVEELEHFSYALIHDLRAPLRAIASFTVLIRKCHEDVAKQCELMSKIEQATERMDHLVTDALNYSKILRQDFPLRPVPLQRLITGLLETYPELQLHATSVHVANDLPVVLGNESALTECFSNLLRNAVKFVPADRKPYVTVGWEPRGEKAKVWVQDNGIGIPQEAHERIFRMFQRMHTSDQYPGTGIGLAIVKKVVERIGGSIGIESEPGEGSRFWLELKHVKNDETDDSASGR